MPTKCVPRPVRWLPIAATLVVGLVAARAQAVESSSPTIELRLSPPFLRPYGLPSLCAMLALPLTAHGWVGAGYELIQDYDAILWTTQDVGYKPIVMSGIHAGAWYRGGAARQSMSWAAGGLITYSNSAISLSKSPAWLDSRTYIVDAGADVSIGHVWERFRFEAFATPAWSYGRVASTPIHTDQRYSSFTYRIGVALAILVGS